MRLKISPKKAIQEQKIMASAPGNKMPVAPTRPPKLITPTKVSGNNQIAEPRSCAAQIPTASIAKR